MKYSNKQTLKAVKELNRELDRLQRAGETHIPIDTIDKILNTTPPF